MVIIQISGPGYKNNIYIQKALFYLLLKYILYIIIIYNIMSNITEANYYISLNRAKAYLLAFAIWSKDNKVDSRSNEWRDLFNVLTKTNEILLKKTCDTLAADTVKPRKVTSASRSRQFANIKYDKLSDLIVVNESDAKVRDYFKLFIDKLKGIMFYKVGALTNLPDTNDISNVYNKREIEMYKQTNKLLESQITPNISSLIFTLKCAPGDEIGLKEMPMETKGVIKTESLRDFFTDSIRSEDPNAAIKDLLVISTEQVENLMEIGDFVRNFKNKNLTVNDFICVILQVAYTLHVFGKIGFVHNDLHTGNILIETLTEPTDFVYILDDQHVVTLKTKYMARIFDFDRSYIIPSSTFFKRDPVANKIADDNPDFINESNYDFYYNSKWIQSDLTNVGDANLTSIMNSIFHDLQVDKSKLNKFIDNEPAANRKQQYVDFSDKPALFKVMRFGGGYKPEERSKVATEIENEILSTMCSPYEWITSELPLRLKLLNIDTNPETCGFEIKFGKDIISTLPISERTKIFIAPVDPTVYTNIKNQISNNQTWQNLAIWQRLIVYGQLVNDNDVSSFVQQQVNDINNAPPIQTGGKKYVIKTYKY